MEGRLLSFRDSQFFIEKDNCQKPFENEMMQTVQPDSEHFV